jgi:hypothetical protein
MEKRDTNETLMEYTTDWTIKYEYLEDMSSVKTRQHRAVGKSLKKIMNSEEESLSI